MVLPPSHKIPRVSWYSGYPPTYHRFAYGNITLCVYSFPSAIQLTTLSILQVLTPNSIAAVRFGLFRVRSPLLTESLFVFSSSGYLDVSVPHDSLQHTMDSCTGDRAFISAGFPHSEICASSAICAFTQLIAACHVLLRLLVPGHSPYALSSLTFSDSPVLFFSKLSLPEIFPSKIEFLISFNQLSLRQYTLFDVLPSPFFKGGCHAFNGCAFLSSHSFTRFIVI